MGAPFSTSTEVNQLKPATTVTSEGNPSADTTILAKTKESNWTYFNTSRQETLFD